jgi:hypothetical protein
MNSVKFFSDSDSAVLEDSINNWLALHPNIQVIQSNINSIVKPDLLGNMTSIEKHVFYILYTTKKARKIKEHTAANVEMIPVSEIAKGISGSHEL